MNTRGVILCGGPGTRLRPLTYYFQKVMVPVGKRQKPLLEYVIRNMKYYGINDLILLVNYKAEQIMNYFEDGARFDVKIRYVHDKPDIRGTAASILNAYHEGAISETDTILVYYGDILSNLNLKALVDYHSERQAIATLALASGFTIRVGVAKLEDNGKIRGFVEKPKIEKPVSIGVVVISGTVLKMMDEFPQRRELDLMGDVIPHLIEQGKPVYGYLTDAYWYDIGSVEAYEKLDHNYVDEVFSYLFEKET